MGPHVGALVSVVMLKKSTTSSDDAALDFTCPVCHVAPGLWCVYVGRRMRAGYETARLHVQRMQQMWLERSDPTAVTTRPHPALRSLQAYDRRQEQSLRAWLREHARLLLDLGQEITTGQMISDAINADPEEATKLRQARTQAREGLRTSLRDTLHEIRNM